MVDSNINIRKSEENINIEKDLNKLDINNSNPISEKEINNFDNNSSSKTTSYSNFRSSKDKNYSLKDFKILQEVGRGSYANIYKAHLLEDKEKIYALKVINKELLEKEKKLHHFYIEYSILKDLNHPFIAKTHAIFEESKKLIILMDYYENGDLFDFVKYNSKFK